MKNKLTKQDYSRMWGEDGPYSQVRLSEETRILDDSISRVFLVVEAEINPFTFEFVQKHRKKFDSDEAVKQLLDHAEFRGEFGYVVSAGEVELRDEESCDFAQKQKDATIETLIRMHRFVMKECGLNKDNRFGVIDDKVSEKQQFVWDDNFGMIENRQNELWENETLVKSPAGIKNNKIRFFIVLAFVKEFDFKKASVKVFAQTLKAVAEKFTVDIEECESFHDHMLITALVPFTVAPAEFIETVIDECNASLKKQMFQKDYFVTNVKRPAPDVIMGFLKQLPLDKDARMKS